MLSAPTAYRPPTILPGGEELAEPGGRRGIHRGGRAELQFVDQLLHPHPLDQLELLHVPEIDGHHFGEPESQRREFRVASFVHQGKDRDGVRRRRLFAQRLLVRGELAELRGRSVRASPTW